MGARFLSALRQKKLKIDEQVFLKVKFKKINSLKPGQNKKGQNIFQLHRFSNTFLQLVAKKKYSKNVAVKKFLGPSYFDPALNGHNTLF